MDTFPIPTRALIGPIGPTSWSDQGVIILRLFKAIDIEIHLLVISTVSSRLTVAPNDICPHLRLLTLEHIRTTHCWDNI